MTNGLISLYWVLCITHILLATYISLFVYYISSYWLVILDSYGSYILYVVCIYCENEIQTIIILNISSNLHILYIY